MVIQYTKHFYDRSKERYSDKDTAYMKKTFEYICKLIKKNKLYPRKGKQPETYEVRYKGMTYIYAKKEGVHTLLTTY